jgi:hypothetical protein
MRRTIEIASGIVMLLAALFSLYLALTQRLGTCFVVGGSWINYAIVYAITIVFAGLGIMYLISALK